MEDKKSKRVSYIVTCLVIILLILGGWIWISSRNHTTITFKNPVGGITNIGDPFILKDNGTYYLYATSEPSIGFKVWQSPNLVDWKEKGLAYDKTVQNEQWATGDFWAPEVIKYRDKFYMTYSARDNDGHLQISIAVSKNPLGPFKDVSTKIIKQKGSYIDGDILLDDDGTPYLYYVKDNSENVINNIRVSQIFVQKMSPDLKRVVGKPKLLIQPDQDWEGLTGDYQWNEGPFVLKRDNKYYLMYSANYYASPDYAIGYAVSDNPMGPFKKAAENPILQKDLKHGISGPGHNSVTVGPDGKTLYIVYHTHTNPDSPSGDRQLNIDRMYFEDGKLKVDGPSYNKREIHIK